MTVVQSLFIALFLVVFVCEGASLRSFRPKPGQRVGIYVGTFDPLHLGHENTALAAMENAGLDYIVMIPNNHTPHKPNATAFFHRLEMLKARYADSPRFLVPDDNNFGTPNGPGIVDYLLKQNAQPHLVAVYGSDVMAQEKVLNQERRLYRKIKDWVVFLREGSPLPKLESTPDFRVQIFQSDFAEYSSTKVRKFRSENPNAPTIPGVHSTTASYIHQHHLYVPAGANVERTENLLKRIAYNEPPPVLLLPWVNCVSQYKKIKDQTR